MTNLVITQTELVTMTSVEVVNLVNKLREEEGNPVELLHKSFLASIDTELESLKKCKISQQNILPSTYINSRGKKYRCYQMNKAGIMQMLNKESALVRYKTQQYVEALENKLKQPTKPLSAMELLKLQYQVIEEQDQKIEEVKEDLREFKDDIPLFAVECEEISNTVKKVGVKALGGYKSNAYDNKSLRGKVYSDIHKQLRREFGVRSYKAIKRKYLTRALEVVENYKLTIALNEEVNLMNSQVAFA